MGVTCMSHPFLDFGFDKGWSRVDFKYEMAEGSQ